MLEILEQVKYLAELIIISTMIIGYFIKNTYDIKRLFNDTLTDRTRSKQTEQFLRDQLSHVNAQINMINDRVMELCMKETQVRTSLDHLAKAFEKIDNKIK
jgi:predicted nuclease with TOPRIM domain